jgi:hypothetical protein
MHRGELIRRHFAGISARRILLGAHLSCSVGGKSRTTTEVSEVNLDIANERAFESC